jgi:hypothetical protein
MTEQQYWDNAMKQIRLNNRVLLHKQNGDTFIPVHDESEPAFEFAVLTDGKIKRLAVF